MYSSSEEADWSLSLRSRSRSLARARSHSFTRSRSSSRLLSRSFSRALSSSWNMWRDYSGFSSNSIEICYKFWISAQVPNFYSQFGICSETSVSQTLPRQINSQLRNISKTKYKNSIKQFGKSHTKCINQIKLVLVTGELINSLRYLRNLYSGTLYSEIPYNK